MFGNFGLLAVLLILATLGILEFPMRIFGIFGNFGIFPDRYILEILDNFRQLWQFILRFLAVTIRQLSPNIARFRDPEMSFLPVLKDFACFFSALELFGEILDVFHGA